MESGGCDIPQIPLQQMEIIGDNITSYFCNSSSNVISCLQSIDALMLLEYAQSQGYLHLYGQNTLGLPIDGLIIPDSITKLFEQNKFSKNISLLTGTTNDEAAFFIAGGFEPGWQVKNLSQTVLSQWVQIFSNGQSAYLNTTYNPYVDPYVHSILVNYYGLTDALSTGLFQCPTRRVAAYLADNGNESVYLYSFDYIPLSSPFVPLSQSVHGQELPFVFYTANASQLTQTIFPVNTFSENEQLLASAMSLLWVRFIVNGNPNIPLNGETTNPLINQLNQLGGWPMYSTNTTANLSSYVIISNVAPGNGSATIRLSTSGYHSPTCAAWDQIVPNPNITKRCSIGYNGPNCTITNDGTLNTVSFITFNLFLFLIYVLS
jgi:carboxylesterase type B